MPARKLRRMTRLVLLLGLFFPLAAQSSYQELGIPMRDGQYLAADFYPGRPFTRKPTILIQTPYNKNLYRGQNPLFSPDKYHVVIVDMRGFYGSLAAAVPGYDLGFDGYECVEWIAKQAWSDGKIGTYGGSALGGIQFQTAKQAPPHLVCAMPAICNFKRGYSNFYYGGDYRKENTEAHSQFCDIPTVLSHPSQDDYWMSYEAENDYADRIVVPLLLVSGWFDHFPAEVIRDFHDLKSNSDPRVRNMHKLVFGPWTHTGVNQIRQGQLLFPQAVGLVDQMTDEFFDLYLLGLPTGYESYPPIQFFQMGDNSWIATDDWYAYGGREGQLYLKPGGRLRPTSGFPAYAVKSFPYDPGNPASSPEEGPWDISGLTEKRGDVLVFSSEVLNAPLKMQGGVRAVLFVSSSCPDTDFSVRLCDVYPDGRSLQMAQGIHRLRYRDSLSQPQLATPGRVYEVTVDLGELAMTFLLGHRLRLDITSSSYPKFEKNLNDGGPMYPPTGPGVVATNFLYKSILYPSRLIWEYH